MAEFNMNFDFDGIGKLIMSMLASVKWEKAGKSTMDPPPVYQTQVFIPISCAAVEKESQPKYLEVMQQFFHEGVEKVINTAIELMPNVIILPELADGVMYWVEEFMERIVKGDPRYTPYLEPVWPTSDWVGKKMVFLRAYFNAVPLGPNGELVVVSTVTSDAYVQSSIDPPLYEFVCHIETELDLPDGTQPI